MLAVMTNPSYNLLGSPNDAERSVAVWTLKQDARRLFSLLDLFERVYMQGWQVAASGLWVCATDKAQ